MNIQTLVLMAVCRFPERSEPKQPGGPGAHLAWSEHPDKTVPRFPFISLHRHTAAL